MKLSHILPVLVALFLYNCGNDKITDTADYNAYLETNIKDTYTEEIQFWNSRLKNTPNQFPYLAKRASAYNTAFKASGQIEYLIKAEEDLVAVNKKTNYNNASYLRSLASNYISQHRFKESLQLLEVAKVNGENLEATKKMLFDVHLELGNYIYAKSYLDEFKNTSDFDYLIRLAKWEDHQGNLDSAIAHLEKAKTIAIASNIKEIKQWAYTNLADFYGHAGRLEESYNHYLNALALDPNDAYSKKGIAWIVYSHEKNNIEALRILNHVTSYYESPDYDLLKAEIAEYSNDMDLKLQSLENYKMSVQNELYGDMYNKYNVMLYTDEMTLLDNAFEIAKREVENRPTPASYDLLAWSYFKAGDIDKAVEIVNEYVDGYTFEPEALYHAAEIYKAAGFNKKVEPLKAELLASAYELGPLMAQRIEQL